MNYIDTATSLLPLLPNLPQTASSGGVTTDGFSATVKGMKLHVTRAENFVNGKVVGRYNISNWTQTTCPPMLKVFAEDIASYFIMRSLYIGDNQNDNDWTDKFESAVEQLDLILDGKMNIFDSAGSLIVERTSSTTDKIESNTGDYNLTFNEDDFYKHKVDTDKLDDILDGR